MFRNLSITFNNFCPYAINPLFKRQSHSKANVSAANNNHSFLLLKAFSKDLMTKYGVPTAGYEIFTNVKEAKHYVIEAEMPVVIKADGLAAGKGVVICESSEHAVATLTQMMDEKIFGDAGAKVMIQMR